MIMLVAVLVLQQATMILFMLDYESIKAAQWKKKEQKMKELLK